MYQQIFASVLFVCLHLSTSVPTDIDGSIEQISKERFLFATKTVTNLVITTTTTSSLLRTWCYSIVSGIIPLTSEGLYSTQRKKRYAEDIVSYIGSSTYTAGPAGNCPARKRRWSFENPFEDDLNLRLEPSSTLLEEVGNEGVSAVAQKSRKDEEEKLLSDSGKDARFGLSLIHTVTQTLTAVSKHITGTVTERVLLTCTPQHLGINSCGH